MEKVPDNTDSSWSEGLDETDIKLVNASAEMLAKDFGEAGSFQMVDIFTANTSTYSQKHVSLAIIKLIEEGKLEKTGDITKPRYDFVG